MDTAQINRHVGGGPYTSGMALIACRLSGRAEGSPSFKVVVLLHTLSTKRKRSTRTHPFFSPGVCHYVFLYASTVTVGMTV